MPRGVSWFLGGACTGPPIGYVGRMPVRVVRPPGYYPYGPTGVVVPAAAPPFVCDCSIGSCLDAGSLTDDLDRVSKGLSSTSSHDPPGFETRFPLLLSKGGRVNVAFARVDIAIAVFPLVPTLDRFGTSTNSATRFPPLLRGGKGGWESERCIHEC